MDTLIRRESSKKAFTLIELLVVIAIIALLAAILFPVFARARENARRTSCQSNMKQLGLGLMQYEQDHDERFPVGVANCCSEPEVSGIGWGEDIYPYVKNIQVYICPDDGINALDQEAGQERVSYATNANLTTDWQGLLLIGGTLSSVNASARTVQLFECAATGGMLDDPPANGQPSYLSATGYGIQGRMNEGIFTGGGWYATGLLSGRGGLVAPNPSVSCNTAYGAGTHYFQTAGGRHVNGSNYLMCDGHVKFLSGDAVSGGLTAASGITPQTTYTSPNDVYDGAEGTEYTGPGAHAVTFSPT